MDKLTIDGYIDGFSDTLEKKGFLGLIARTYLARKAADRLEAMEEASGEGAKVDQEMGEPVSRQLFGAPKVLSTEVPDPEQVNREAARKDDHEAWDPKIQQLAANVGQELPAEVRSELNRTGLFKRLISQLAERTNASSKQPA